jgi:hypothetical protein
MIATVCHITSGMGIRKFQATGFLLDRVYITIHNSINLTHCGRVTQICVFALQRCKTGDANLRFNKRLVSLAF